jgi:hypothetical protein
MCDHPKWNKLKTASHTSSKCWRKHADLCPEHLRDKFGKRKNNYLKGNRKSKEGQENHTNEPDYSKDDNTVLNLAYFNYAKANKLKVKASNRIRKLLSASNGDINSKRSGIKLKRSDTKSNEDFDSTKFDGPMKQCGKFSKCGNHTADECMAGGKDDKSSKSEEANLASGGKGKSLARRVQKLIFLDYNNSYDEEDSLHYLNNNRIKACLCLFHSELFGRGS